MATAIICRKCGDEYKMGEAHFCAWLVSSPSSAQFEMDKLILEELKKISGLLEQVLQEVATDIEH